MPIKHPKINKKHKNQFGKYKVNFSVYFKFSLIMYNFDQYQLTVIK